ncbi:SDR family oxidoreductase [Candidatus Uabimicrobium sp. HlEnr_7]|uniref:SDR family oxidoreductase n=1 Tax=Candidatus Uabimicrobium helgolandensis TaxID=3095367 RepID=UPI003555EFC2
MEQKSIFITGAASGIGKATAITFAKEGWFVGLFDTNEDGLKQLADQIGSNVCYRKLDVTSYEQTEEGVAYFAEKTNNKMNVLFNNAGIMHMDFFDKISRNDHMKAINVNIVGVVNGVLASLELLKNTPKSHIISMSSASAFYGTPELVTYSATKFFVRGFTEGLNLELEKYNITVSDLMPYYVKTPMINDQKYQANTVRKMGVNLTPEQIAKTVWKAAHKKKVHWVPANTIKNLISFIKLPFLGKTSMKWLS